MRSRWWLALLAVAAAAVPAGSGRATLASIAPGPQVSRHHDTPGPDMPRQRPSGADQATELSYVTDVVYFVPRDRPDQGLDVDGTISASIGSMLGWFNAQMGSQPRMQRTASGAFDIVFVSGNKAASAYARLSDITSELASRGFKSATKRYLVFAAVNEGNVCGEGDYPLQPGASGHYAVTYLDSSAACGARDFGNGSAAGAGKAEAITAHEWLHMEGIEPLLAPHVCATSLYHVCTAALWEIPSLDPEETDVVFPIINLPLSQKVLDRGRDDYLDAPWPWIPNLRSSLWLG